MAPRKINSFLKILLEFGPIVAFFIGYTRLKDEVFTIGSTEYSGFIVVTAVFIPVLLLSIGALWALSGKLSKMQVVTAVLVVVFGGMSIAFNDERFFKMKPSIIYALFAGILGFGLLRGESYLRHVMEEVLPMRREGWMILTRRVTLFFLGLMIANEVIWRNMSTDTWVNFKTFGLPLATLLFFGAQARLFSTYGISDEKSAPEG